MLIGKRPRPPGAMRRTTSMSGGVSNLEQPHDEALHNTPTLHLHGEGVHDRDDQNLLDMVVSPNSSSHNNHVTQNYQTTNPPTPLVVVDTTPHFLRTCGLCKSRLASGRDIFMYRGDAAFCSVECREQRIKEDSRKEKWIKLAASNKEDYHRSPPSAAVSATAKASTKTKAAACT